MELARALGDNSGIASCLGELAVSFFEQCDYAQCVELSDQAIARYMLAENMVGVLSIRFQRAWLEMERGQLDLAEKFSLAARIALTDFPQGDIRWLWVVPLQHEAEIGCAQGNLGYALDRINEGRGVIPTRENPFPNAMFDMIEGRILSYLGETGRAIQLLDSAYTFWRSVKRLDVIASGIYLARTLIAQGDIPAALPPLIDVLKFCHQRQDRLNIARLLHVAAYLALQLERPVRSARLWGATEALREQIGAAIWPVDLPEYERRVSEARAQLLAEEWHAAWAAGRALTWEQAADEALAWLSEQPNTAGAP